MIVLREKQFDAVYEKKKKEKKDDCWMMFVCAWNFRSMLAVRDFYVRDVHGM